MEITLGNLDRKSNLYDIKSALEKVLHSADHSSRFNFQVLVNQSDVGGWENNGTGSLILPSRQTGRDFLKKIKKKELKVTLNGRPIFFDESKRVPKKVTIDMLKRVPYRSPDDDKRIDSIRQELKARRFRIDELQFGCWKIPPSSRRPGVFAIEWSKKYTSTGGYAVLGFDYDKKLLRIQLGDPLQDDVAHSVVLKFANIQDIWAGLDFGKEYICFDLLTPPSLEREWMNRTSTGNTHRDNMKFRERIGAIDKGHAAVAPYAHHVRVMLFDDTQSFRSLEKFNQMCNKAGLRLPKKAQIDAEKLDLFSPKRLFPIQKFIKGLPWPIAFQVETLLRGGLLNTDELQDELFAPINDLSRSQDLSTAGTIMRYFVRSLPQKPSDCDLLKFFHQSYEERNGQNITATVEASSGGLMLCHHVTFTPTRMMLEGPYAIQSNRVIREYTGFHDHFIRVDFRDEDRLQYRWDREVDGATFLRERVGGILENGFSLAGRQFDFLAYSSSALRNHAVWFVNPFQHPIEGLVTAAKIRRSLGDFSALLDWPAKFGARLSQAFTATDPSVRIKRDQWSTMPDIGNEPYLFTDGVGTISTDLGHLIYQALCKAKPDLHGIEPSVYQIRFLGYKGVVRVDPRLSGIQMRLRPSMEKFKAHEVLEADIEIARAFSRPGKMYLNRPLIMILEDRKVKKDVFLVLQQEAIKTARLAGDSLQNAKLLLKATSLGTHFSLVSIIDKLAAYGLDFKRQDRQSLLDFPFLSNLINYCIRSVLRDIKFRARIQVPKGWSLVGVADEGPAYIKDGCDPEDVFMLREGEIYVCIQLDPDSEPIYMTKQCTVSRSPTVHPGDVQRVWAIGKPPEDKICSFRNLKNCIVFPSDGVRSQASCLAGGDLDGDLFDVHDDSALMPIEYIEPANYPPAASKLLTKEQKEELIENGVVNQEKIIPHLRDFIVEYINSDVLGLLSDIHLTRADQSSEGTSDPGCLELARLCSEAVDYIKNGNPVDIRNAPYKLMPYNPDWKKGEVDSPRNDEFYRSERALGHLYRAVDLAVDSPERENPQATPGLEMRRVLEDKINSIGITSQPTATVSQHIRRIFKSYVDELKFICSTHTLSDLQGATLTEEEVVIGSILSNCSQHRWRQERIYRMRLHSMNLVHQIRAQFYPSRRYNPPTSEDDTRHALEVAWLSWQFTVKRLAECDSNERFGLNSFGLIALKIIFDCIDVL